MRPPPPPPFCGIANPPGQCSVRNPKESAVYRSVSAPPGQPFVTGLGLPTATKYQSRDGDMRDIWKLAVEKGNGKMLSVRGADVHEIDMSLFPVPVPVPRPISKTAS